MVHTKQKARIAIVASEFNAFITKRLLKGCLDEFNRKGVTNKHVHISWVPGSLEIPVAALKLANKKNIDAVICLGAILRGETYHFELVARGAAYGVVEVSLKTGKPIIFGILATDTVNQAYKRSQAKGDNKGKDAALAALAMINVFNKIK